ncbi:hypothetical protein KSZ_52300 [Dictyobacter formicarum]|uniref:Transposase DDE domain-containing protein n=1 Tax=Dictyobacter formicarum TaxID=2778368 RepID=A0ABQ3VLZ2_9CHLR|nr:hypothetical protein KSZ_52300 [Dictyobacter formicarum]
MLDQKLLYRTGKALGRRYDRRAGGEREWLPSWSYMLKRLIRRHGILTRLYGWKERRCMDGIIR